MRSKTSFFNKTMFLKSVTRFWPVWGSYLVIWLIALPVVMLSNIHNYSRYPLRDLQWMLYEEAIYGGVIMGAVFGIFAAMAVWSFLYNARATHGMACLPVRREGQFFSAMLAGIAPLLAANVVIFLLTMLICAGYGGIPALGIWLAVVSLILLFFYGFATLCAQMTGSIVILPLVYIILNFVVIGMEQLLRGVFSQFIYGLDADFGTTTRMFSPVVGYFTSLSTENIYDPVLLAKGRYETIGYNFAGWPTVLLYAVVGIVMLAGALLLFRARRMETAGDVVAVKPLKPVFRWCMALGFGVCFASLMYVIILNENDTSKNAAFLALLIFLLIGAFIGWFIAEMLIHKSFKVFHKSTSWAGLGLCGLVIVAAMLGMKLDVFGVERRIPAAERVGSATVYSSGGSAYFETAEGIEQVRALHQKILDNRDWNEYDRYYYAQGKDYVQCSIDYYLKNGGVVSRRYILVYTVDRNTGEPAELHEVAAAQELMNSQEAIANRKKLAFPMTRDNINYANVNAAMSAVECAELLGYDTPEEYVLREHWGYSERDFRTAYPDEEGRKAVLGQCVLDYAINSYELYDRVMGVSTETVYATGSDLYGSYADGELYEVPTVTPTPAPGYRYYGGYEDYDLSRFVDLLDWNDVYFFCDLPLTPAEAFELYDTCVVPDMEDGALGRVWIIEGEDYNSTVYNARIDIEAREDLGRDADMEVTVGHPAGSDWYENFYTVPTVDSVRTNAWLRQHGITLHTYGEFR